MAFRCCHVEKGRSILQAVALTRLEADERRCGRAGAAIRQRTRGTTQGSNQTLVLHPTPSTESAYYGNQQRCAEEFVRHHRSTEYVLFAVLPRAHSPWQVGLLPRACQRGEWTRRQRDLQSRHFEEGIDQPARNRKRMWPKKYEEYRGGTD